jgi:uncharacterized protein
MSVTLPESVDAWRMVSARRSFEGTLPIASMARLREALASSDGIVEYAMDFGRDELGISYIDVRAHASLNVVCQRSLEPFALPVSVSTRLGLIRHERDEAGLPPECEPLLVAEDGRMHLADVVEDELLLALPLVPVNPESRLPDEVTSHESEAESSDEGRSENPFAVLRELKKQ